VPSFDVVRVEPSGETVVAGLAAPKAKVEILDGSNAIATAEANETGEWAMALDKPLPPGTHDLAIRTTSEDQKTVTLSDQRVAVSVPEKGSDVLVVLNSPDAASKVLQVPENPAGQQTAEAPQPETSGKAPAEQQAAATTNAGAAPAEAGPSAAASSTTVEEKTPPPAAGAETTVAAAPEAEPAAPTPPPAADGGKGENAASPATEQPKAAETGTDASGGASSSAPETASAEPKPEAASPAAEPQPKAAEPQPAAEAPAPPPPQVGVASVEADTGGDLFIAGTSNGTAEVRVYINDELLGNAEPGAGGAWTLQAHRDMPAGQYRIRADQVDAAGNVIVRAEVPFEREVEVAVLKPVGGAGAATGAKVSGASPQLQMVTIKRGDNLWRLSRTWYGKGVRWSTLYTANKDQIRNPRWIYPGQVFMVPAGDTRWKK
jgi:nucleoid-associated protein YgaU